MTFEFTTLHEALKDEITKTVYGPGPEFKLKSDQVQRNDIALLTDSWFDQAEGYIKGLFIAFKTSHGNEATLLKDEIENVKLDIIGLYNRRLGKLVDIALLNSDGGQFNADNMTSSEKELYKKILQLLVEDRQKFEDRFFNNMTQGRP